jgi:hypothetical protein
MSALRRLQKRCPHGRRDVYRDEAVGREQVVLAAFVDDSKVAIALGLFVRKHGVNLVSLERCLIALVPDAQRIRAPGPICGG